MFAVIKDHKIVEYPIFLGDISLRHPSVGLPITWDGGEVEGTYYERVHLTPPPSTTFITQTVVEDTPALDGNMLKQKWKIVAASAEEIAIRNKAKSDELRHHRNALLAQSDWRVIKALEDGVELDPVWKAYRQALRDLPSLHGFPSVDLPKPPQSD